MKMKLVSDSKILTFLFRASCHASSHEPRGSDIVAADVRTDSVLSKSLTGDMKRIQ